MINTGNREYSQKLSPKDNLRGLAIGAILRKEKVVHINQQEYNYFVKEGGLPIETTSYKFTWLKVTFIAQPPSNIL
jgi:hypothetical protein